MIKRLPTRQETGFDPWVRKNPWRRQWHPTPVLLPGKFHGQRSLVGYSPWGRKESDMTERLHFHFTQSCSLRVQQHYCCSVTKSCPTLCDSVNCSIPGFPVLHHHLEFAQIHVHWVSDAVVEENAPKTLLLKHANHHLSLQQIPVVTAKITDYKSPQQI